MWVPSRYLGQNVAAIGWSGGKRFNAVLNDLVKGASRKYTLKVGFLADKTYPDGTNVASVAFMNEYGTSRIPARPFFRRMIDKKSGSWASDMSSLMRHNNMDVGKSLNIMGELIKDSLTNSIATFEGTPNAASTVAHKGFNKPLIDTGVMQRSVGYEVTENDV